MKKIFTLIIFMITGSLAFSQPYIVPLPNADVESTSAMSTTNNVKFTIDGMFVQESVAGSFDEANSGLAPGMGVGGSQALKIVTETTGSTLGWHTQFGVNPVDISGYGNADFVFSYRIKSGTVPAQYPIWMVLTARDEDGVDVTANTVTYTNGGKISSGAGVNDNTMSLMNTDFQTAWLPFSIKTNTGGGKNAKTIELRTQIARFVDTYYVDNVSLTSSAPLSTKTFETIEVKMFPNPTNSKTIIKSASTIENVSMYSLSGKLIFEEKTNTNEYTLDVSSYAKGLYLLNVSNSKGKATSKIVVD